MLTLFDRVIATEERFSSPPYNDDTEAASQQLLAENSPLKSQPAAVRGANLLNAARALPRSAAVAPQRQTAKAGKLEKPGKLKRVSLPEQRPRKVRGAEIYNLESSPQKRISLSPPVAAVEVAEQEDTRFANEIEDVVPETSQAQPDEDRPLEMPESSNVAAEDGDANKEPSVPPSAIRQETALAATRKRQGGPPKRKSDQSAASARPSDVASAGIPEEVELSVNRATGQDLHLKQEHIAAASANQIIKLPAAKKRKVLRGPKFRDPEAANLEEDVITPSTGEHNAQPNGDPQPEVRIPFRATRLRTAQAEAEKAKDTSATAIIAGSSDRWELSLVGPSRATRSSKPAPKPSRRKISQKKATPAIPTAELEEADDEDAKEGTRSTGKKQQGVEATNNEHVEAQEIAETFENDEQHDKQDARVDIDGAVLATRATASHHSTYLPALEKVFQFTNSEERPGVCLTNLGKNIHRACDRSRVMLSQLGEGPSLEDIAKCRDDLASLLASVDSKVKVGRMVAFKRDAFGYLFRSLALVLKAMHDKLQELDGDISDSLKAMQILYPTSATYFISRTPLTPGRIRFVRLRAAEQMRQVRLDEERKWEEQKQELARREETIATRKERRRRWQDLHIFRMYCEPDPTRRKRLRFVEPIEAVETDANGEQFERVPVFGERSMPPPQWTAASSGIEWTTEQEIVLLDALQSSAVLEKIFRQHCCPGGALRDFTVSDFAVKSAWVRSGWAQLSQQHGWEIPEWVKKIPVLP
ncbi:hypothetical protein EJ07DRAFT_159396 [Lizonia empirigonia]|nr:hypothetical protein EJ07DRAFT_159396 [Lizonia empirigonia]